MLPETVIGFAESLRMVKESASIASVASVSPLLVAVCVRDAAPPLFWKVSALPLAAIVKESVPLLSPSVSKPIVIGPLRLMI